MCGKPVRLYTGECSKDEGVGEVHHLQEIQGFEDTTVVSSTRTLGGSLKTPVVRIVYQSLPERRESHTNVSNPILTGTYFR